MSTNDAASEVIAQDDARRVSRAGSKSRLAPLQDVGATDVLSSFPLLGTDRMLAAFTPDYISLQDVKAMRRDGQLRLGMTAIRAPLKNTSRYYIEGRDKRIAEAAWAACDGVLGSFIAAGLSAVEWGFSCAEQRWEVRDVNISSPGSTGGEDIMRGLYVPKAPRMAHPQDVDIYTKQGEFAGFKVNNATFRPGETYYVSYRGEFGNFYGESIYVPAWVPWRFCGIVKKLWGRFIEKFALGSWLGRVPVDKLRDGDGDTHDAIRWMNAVLANLRGGGAMSVPSQHDERGNPLWDAKIMESGREGRTFAEAVTYFEAAKLRGILVPERTVTQDVLTGSHSMATAHAELFFQSLDEIIDEQILRPFSEQILVPFTRLNFGASAAAPRLKASRLSHEGKARLVELLKAAMTQPIRTQDGRVYTPAALMDITQTLEQLNIPYRPVEEAATEDPMFATPQFSQGDATANLNEDDEDEDGDA